MVARNTRGNDVTRWCAAAAALCVLVLSQRTAEAVRHEREAVRHEREAVRRNTAPVAHGFSRASGPFDAATALLTQAVDERTIAGAVAAVSHHGKVTYLQAVGLHDLETRAPMTERTLFRIYSMTKPITAAAVMMLHESGR